MEGTKMELAACLRDAEDHVNGDAEYAVSEREIDCFEAMVEMFFEWMQDMALVTDEGELDREALQDVCVAMSRANEEEL